LPAPALVFTVDGQIIESNPEGVKLLGAADAVALRGRPMGDWTPAAQRGALAAALREAVTQRQELHLTVEYAGEPPREVRAVIVNVDPMRQAPKLLFLALDVSREALLQQRLLQADRLSQLGALVSGVATAGWRCNAAGSRRPASGPACPCRATSPPWRATRRSCSRCS